MTTTHVLKVSPATHSRRRRFSARGLQRECRELRELCHIKAYATQDELRAYWPGGEENADRGMDGWIYCYQQLGRFLGRKELMERTRAAAREQLADAVRAAAAAEAEPVELTVGAFSVHPKSVWALQYLNAIARLLGPLVRLQADAVDAALDREAASPIPGLDRAVHDNAFPELLQAMTVRIWAWIITTPGSGLPWNEGDADINPPEWTAQLVPQDLLVLDGAHRRVNGERLAIMTMAFPSSEHTPSALALGGFIAGYAHENGLQPRELMRQWSYGEIVASAIAAVDAHQQSEARSAAERAKRERQGAR